MSTRGNPIRLGLLLAVLWLGARDAGAQLAMFVGWGGAAEDPVPISGVQTFLQTGPGANRDGVVNNALFNWSHAPCPGAAKIKFFRPLTPYPVREFAYLDQRGPFDVTTSRQSVRLDPPVSLRAGDIIAITNVTPCGGPVTVSQVLPGGLRPPGPYYAVPGDVVSNLVPTTPVPSSGPVIGVYAVDQGFFLLKGRFLITLLATDPRSGVLRAGTPVSLGDSSGYFSLPDLTYDAVFPEVTVKMVDATGAPALGGGFWFFHAPLTDVQYTITVLDQTTGAVKTYSNSPGESGQLCGGVDTSAFPGP